MKNSEAKFLLALLIVTPFIVSGAIVVQSWNNEVNTYEPIADFALARTPHGAISIYGDYDFNDTATNEGWAGNGSEVDPFIIEGYTISYDYSCITVYDTSYYYIIQDCEFTTGGGTDYTFALNFWNAPHGILNASVIHDKVGGARIDHSPGFTVMNTNFSSLVYGGLEIYRSSNCILDNNIFNTTGVEIIGYTDSEWQHIFTNNIVNGKPLGYFFDETDLIIDGSFYGQIILADCTDCNVSDAAISNTTAAIALGFCIGCDVSFNEVSWNSFGILLSGCQEVFAHNNTLGPHNDYGIHLNDSSLCNVQGNHVFGNLQAGIDCVKGSGNLIDWNTVNDNNFYGIVCWEVTGFNIHNNLVFQNVDGIGVNMAPASQVTYNTVENNTGVGITVSWGSNDCDIYGNHIGWNSGGNSMDDGSSNMWDNGINMGNFWNDYSGTGTYSIPGAAGSVDNYPFQLGDEPPVTTTTTTTTTETTTTETTETTTTTTTTDTSTGSTTSSNSTIGPLSLESIFIISIAAGSAVIIIIVLVLIKNRP